MARDRQNVDEALRDLTEEREEAEALATQASDRLLRVASRIIPLDEVNPQEIEGAALDYAAQVRRYQALEKVIAKVRKLWL